MDLDVDEARASGRSLIGVGENLKALVAKTSFSGDIATSLPGSSIIDAARNLEQRLQQVLQAQADWPPRMAKEVLEGVATITHQDELGAAGLNLDTSGDPPAPGGKLGGEQPGGDQPAPSPDQPTPTPPGMPPNLTEEGKKFLSNFNPESVPEQYRQSVIDTALKTGVPPELLAAQIEQESGWKTDVWSDDGKGSLGLSQALPPAWSETPTGKAHPLTPANQGKADDPRRNPAWSIQAMAEYDLISHRNLGDKPFPGDPVRSMLDGYNGGPSLTGARNGEANNYYHDVTGRLAKYQQNPSAGVPGVVEDPSSLTQSR